MLFLQAQARCLSKNALSHEGAKKSEYIHTVIPQKKKPEPCKESTREIQRGNKKSRYQAAQ